MFEVYEERRERVEAFQFLEASQASDIGQLFYAKSYTVHNVNRDDLYLLIEQAGEVVRVDRGDYLARPVEWSTAVPVVVPAREFYAKWEKP